MDRTPFFVFDGVVSLFPSDANGQALTGSPIWLGSCVNAMRVVDRLNAIRLASTGARYKRVVHVDEGHEISFDRVWIVMRTAPQTFRPGRNQQYVLQVVWTDQGCWYQRTYFGVTGSLAEMASRGVLEFDQRQTFEAQYFTDAGGTIGNQVYVPTPPSGATQPVGFFFEQALEVGSYLLGTYRWGSRVTVTGASVIALASQGTATVLTLEVNGSLTAATVTIPIGTLNQEVTAAGSFTALALNIGDSVRWKVTSGPNNGVQAAWQVTVRMDIQA